MSKIAHIITGLEIGGAEQMLMRLLLSDPEAKDTAIIISLNGIGTLGLKLRELGYRVYPLHFSNLVTLPLNFWHLMKILKTYKPEIVQTWMYNADFFGGLAAYITGYRRIIWGIRRTESARKKPSAYLAMRLCSILSYLIPVKIICVAQAAKQKHISYGYDAKKMCVIPNGFDFSRFDVHRVDNQRVRHELGLIPSELVIGCIGRFHIDKGQDVFINAIALMSKISVQPIRFMLVGRGCDRSNLPLVNLLDSLELTSSFILLGEREDIPECLAALDVFCMPSRTEGFPNGLGEAMSMGLPCVATCVGDTSLLAEDTVSLVKPNNPEALANALTEMVQMMPEKRKALGQKAAIQIRNKFSIEQSRERFYAVYREVMELAN